MSCNNVLEFCTKRVYHCPFLMRVINLIKDAEICKLGQILTVFSKFELDFPPIISMRADEKTSSFLICSNHLHLLAETKYSYTGNDMQFPEFGKNYCKSCIKHYLQNMCSIYLFVVMSDK